MRNSASASCRLRFVVTALAALLTGCGAVVGTTINTANTIDQNQDRTKLNSLVAKHLQWVDELRAAGNPLGDYLWARANEDGIAPSPIKDPATLRQMYADAAAKGSVDAQIVLAYKRFVDGKPRDSKIVEEAKAKEPIWREGLAMMEAATQKRCFYLKPYVFAPHNRRCLVPRVAADDIWPKFRDGYTYPKDTSIRDYWYDKAIACDATPEFQQALRDCPVFGRTSYRAKD